jgi:hypothetical protein
MCPRLSSKTVATASPASRSRSTSSAVMFFGLPPIEV